MRSKHTKKYQYHRAPSFTRKQMESQRRKYYTELCNDDMTFDECELAILRHAVDESEKTSGQKLAMGEQVKEIIKILEDFLIVKKLICYGGTAINNILPKYAQFYNREIEIPDYDFFSPQALEDAKELADIYYKAGFTEVEAKSGVHQGTYKVFVNFIPVADITQLHPMLYKNLGKEAITVAGIKYTPPNYLRMSMYLELSRPMGDVSRWEKVLKRLTLLNTHHPMKTGFDCTAIDFQRKMETGATKESEQIYFIARDAFIELGVVFFGGYASSLYSKYMPKDQQRLVEKIPDFDVLAEEPEKTSMIIRERLTESGFKDVHEIKHEAIGEVIPEHIEIQVGKETVAFIYRPIACHNFNTIRIGAQEINVATIDTMLSFYLAFIYADAPYYYRDRILCMAKFLFDVEQKNRLEQRGLLKRFSISCYGKQPTLEDMRAEKTEKFKELAEKRGTHEYEEWFMKYTPAAKFEKGSKEKKGAVAKDIRQPSLVAAQPENITVAIEEKEKRVQRKKRRGTKKEAPKGWGLF